jgi:hypothetical protein
MAKLHTIVSVTLRLAICAICLPGSAMAGQPGKQLQCTHTLPQYTEALRQFEILATEARSQAAKNPLYESDVAYYASVLADARACVKTLAPVTTAAR